MRAPLTTPLRPPSSSRPPEPDARQDRFVHIASGRYCEDGADILEGPLDQYGHDPGKDGSVSYGGRCRAACRKRPRCKFYTAYSSGWCQLGTRCQQLTQTGDAMVFTFRKEKGDEEL